MHQVFVRFIASSPVWLQMWAFHRRPCVVVDERQVMELYCDEDWKVSTEFTPFPLLAVFWGSEEAIRRAFVVAPRDEDLLAVRKVLLVDDNVAGASFVAVQTEKRKIPGYGVSRGPKVDACFFSLSTTAPPFARAKRD